VELSQGSRRLARALAIAGPAAAMAAVAAAGQVAAGAARVDPSRVRCERGCAGLRAAAAGSLVRWTGRGLGGVVAVDFPAAGGGRFGAHPLRVTPRSVKAIVPADVVSGRPALRTASGARGVARRPLRIVPRAKLPAPGSFRLLGGGIRPRPALFDAPAHLRYRFRARGRSAVELRVARAGTGAVVRSWVRRGVTPYTPHAQSWQGTGRAGALLHGGRYVLRVGRRGSRGRPAASFRLASGVFPVRGPHGFGGPVQRFGAPRTGGRVHQGQDILAACGTREIAARGGRVQTRGYDPVLYGNWLVIDARGTTTDYRYAHLIAPTPLHTGERVRTGEAVGRVGRAGNARTVGCMLHFEIWPDGWLHGSPVDPLPVLERWDRRS
jgi:murein DD-endopeptidase MepM/ murein hydrolase activator NlpD